MRRTTVFGLLLASVTVLLPFAALAPAAQAAPAASAVAPNLPGGRSTYVVSMMGGTNLHMYSKLAMYLFASDGTVTQKYWYWRQDSISGYQNAAKWKPNSGTTTYGCRYSCAVRTPLGFQRGTTPKSMAGTWTVNRFGHLRVQWTATAYETFRMDSSQAGFTTLTIMTGYQSEQIVKGWGFGSNAGQNAGVSMGSVHASWQLLGPLATNAYSVPTVHYSKSSFYWPDYAKCPGGYCLQANTNTAADKTQWYHSYFTGNPVTDGRKNFWNAEKGVVTQAASPGSNCISVGGGHTHAALQIIDDNGKFLGWVGAEASLDRRAYGQATVSAWTNVYSNMLKTISTEA